MTWTVKQELWIHDSAGMAVATAETPELAQRVVAMANALDALLPIARWIAENDGECIGDHPHHLAALDAALAAIDGAEGRR